MTRILCFVNKSYFDKEKITYIIVKRTKSKPKMVKCQIPMIALNQNMYQDVVIKFILSRIISITLILLSYLCSFSFSSMTEMKP